MVIAYYRGNDWVHTTDAWQHLRVSSGQLHATLAQLVAEGIMEGRWEQPEETTPGLPARHMYRLRADTTAGSSATEPSTVDRELLESVLRAHGFHPSDSTKAVLAVLDAGWRPTTTRTVAAPKQDGP